MHNFAAGPVTSSSLRRDVAALRTRISGLQPTAAQLGDDPAQWAHSMTGFTLDPWQAGVLRSRARRLAMLCCRQSGKTETVSLLAAWIALNGGLVVVLAPSLRQSANLFRRMREHLQRAGTNFARETATEIAVTGGGIAICLPGDRPSMVRGISLRHAGEAALVVDEAAFVKDGLWPVASPMLAAAPQARMLLLSTPAGPAGEFHRLWTASDEPWERVTVRASDCPRISPAFLEEERRRLGRLFDQEYDCEFLATGAAVFSPDALAAMFGDGDHPAIDLLGDVERPKSPPTIAISGRKFWTD
jgi:hypothetical protein